MNLITINGTGYLRQKNKDYRRKGMVKKITHK